MNVLITGGAGFIGSHLVDRFLERGDEVFVIDDLSTGSLKNIGAHQRNGKFHFTADTILNAAVMEELVSRCELIYHMAAAVGVRLIMNRPVETLETNVNGTEMVLKLANKYKRKVLIASTSEVYGKVMNGPDVSPLSEDSDSLMGTSTKRRWAYACSKALDEFLALAYFEEKKLPVVIVRLFNTVGPRQTGEYGMVIPNFVQKALLGKPIAVHGDGTQSRSFIHVSDVMDAVLRLMEAPAAVGEIFNVGTSEEVTMGNLALMVKEITGSPSEIVYIPYEKAYGPGFEDMQRRCPDTSKIGNLIGFTPRYSLRDIIASVIDYYKS
jgi:UDP-glucose 4-epimerase